MVTDTLPARTTELAFPFLRSNDRPPFHEGRAAGAVGRRHAASRSARSLRLGNYKGIR